MHVQDAQNVNVVHAQDVHIQGMNAQNLEQVENAHEVQNVVQGGFA